MRTFILALVTSTSAFLVATSAVGGVWTDQEVPLSAKISLTIGVIMGAALAQWYRAEANAARQREQAADERVRRELAERAVLLRELGKRVALVLSELRVLAAGRASNRTELREKGMKSCLEAICEVFEQSHRATGEQPLDVTDFECTFFEYFPSAGQDGELRRAYWRYPPTRIPQTKVIDMVAHHETNAVRCVRQKTLIVQADCSKNFKETRPGQAERYVNASMVCVPVWKRRDVADPQDEPEVQGVLTLVTDRRGVFKDSPDDVKFLNLVLEPFLAAIRLVYGLTEEAIPPSA